MCKTRITLELVELNSTDCCSFCIFDELECETLTTEFNCNTFTRPDGKNGYWKIAEPETNLLNPLPDDYEMGN